MVKYILHINDNDVSVDATFFFSCGWNGYQFLFYFIFKIRQVFLTSIHDKTATPQTSLRPQEQNQQTPQDQRDQLVIRTMFLHHTQRRSRYGMKMRFAPIQLLRWNWEWFCSGTQMITDHLSTDDISVQPSFDWCRYRYHSKSHPNPKNEIQCGRAIGDNARKEEVRVA